MMESKELIAKAQRLVNEIEDRNQLLYQWLELIEEVGHWERLYEKSFFEPMNYGDVIGIINGYARANGVNVGDGDE